jgi:hypothetical protein
VNTLLNSSSLKYPETYWVLKLKHMKDASSPPSSSAAAAARHERLFPFLKMKRMGSQHLLVKYN